MRAREGCYLCWYVFRFSSHGPLFQNMGARGHTAGSVCCPYPRPPCFRLIHCRPGSGMILNIRMYALSSTQATGYGVVEFAKCMLEDKGDTLKGKRCLITGSGKVGKRNTRDDAPCCTQHIVVYDRYALNCTSKRPLHAGKLLLPSCSGRETLAQRRVEILQSGFSCVVPPLLGSTYVTCSSFVADLKLMYVLDIHRWQFTWQRNSCS